MTRYTESQIVRLALIYAIEEHQSFVDSGGDFKGRSAKLVQQFKILLSRKYGGPPADPFVGCRDVTVEEISKGLA